jgi:hypothetical protein
MVKRYKLATRAFGAEPGMPDVAALAEWIAEHRGTTADIITYRLDQSLAPQIEVGIMTPCAGGKFYADRIRQSISGISDNAAVGELHVDTPAIIEDAAGIVVQKKGAWCAMPAPRLLGITDEYYDDVYEWSDAICGVYRTIMRLMRDSGVAGNILICETIDDAELTALAGQKVFFFQPASDRESLASLMEHQRQIAVGKNHLETVFDLTEEYTIQKIFIIDPDPSSINLALSQLDPDQVVAGGYCLKECGEYWKTLAENAVYWK